MDELKLYAAAIRVQKIVDGNMATIMNAHYVFAINQDEAVGKSIRMAQDAYPQTSGYFNHHSVVCEVRNADIMDFALIIKGKQEPNK